MNSTYFKAGRVRIKEVRDPDFIGTFYAPEILTVPCGKYAEKPALIYINPAYGKANDFGLFGTVEAAREWLVDNGYLQPADTGTIGSTWINLPEIDSIVILPPVEGKP